MTWPILVCINIITGALVVLLERVLMKDENSDPIGYAIIFQFGVGFFSLFFALIVGRFAFPPIEQLLPNFILSTLLWAGSTVFGYKALQKLNAGEVTILGVSNTIVAMALGAIFLGEILKTSTILGAALVLFAIWIVTTEKLTFASRDGIIFALVSAVCAGVAVVNDAIILRMYEAFSYTAVMSFLPGIVLLFFFPKHIIKMKNLFNKKALLLMATYCPLYSIQALAYYSAFKNGAQISQLVPLTKSSIILTVILAAIFLKERTNLKKKIAAGIVVTIGAILLG